MSSIAAGSEIDLADLLDRALGTGVVLLGELTLSVADIELVYLDLRALLASVGTLEEGGTRFANGRPAHGLQRPPAQTEPYRTSPGQTAPPAEVKEVPSARDDDRRDDRLDRGLGQLVLMITELLRQVMERQALRRVDAGLLHPDEVDRLGRAFARLEEQMQQLKDRFGVDDDDLALRLVSQTGSGQ